MLIDKNAGREALIVRDDVERSIATVERVLLDERNVIDTNNLSQIFHD